MSSNKHLTANCISVLISSCWVQRAQLQREEAARQKRGRPKTHSSCSCTCAHPAEQGTPANRVPALPLNPGPRAVPGGLLPSQHKQQLSFLSTLTEVFHRHWNTSDPFNPQSRGPPPAILRSGFKGLKTKTTALLLISFFLTFFLSPALVL